jgi:FKBP-type peptidyl-prolyl cis-trans isomerase FklB
MSMIASNPIRWTALAGLILILSPRLVHSAQDTAPAAAAAQDASPLTSENEKLSYALGLLFGKQLRAQAIEPELDLVVQGLKDAHSGSKTLLTDEAVRAAVNGLQSQLKKKQIALHDEKLLKSKKDGEAFLAENKVREGVVALESGLQYKILKAADGTKPTIDDTVVGHFRGTLIDGTEFASSYKTNKPATFPVKTAVKGWTEALQLMPVGSKWQFFIPANLAYGERGSGRRIGPNATLIFEVELISIKDNSGKNAHAVPKKESGKAALSVTKEAPFNGVAPERPDNRAVHAAPALTIIVSFKLDRRLTEGLYMGERWVSPPKYNQAAVGKSVTVEARVHGRDAGGTTREIRAKWIPADPEMVTVTPSDGNAATITVHRVGQSTLQVVSEGTSKELAIKAEYVGNLIQVDISQK